MEKDERYRMIGAIMHTLPVIEGRIGRVMNEKLIRIVDEQSDRLTRLQLLTLFLLIHREHACKKQTNMTVLAAAMHVSAQQATRLVDGLIKNHLAERYQDSENRRLVLIRATKEGYEYMETMKTKALPAVDEAFSSFSDEQLRTLYECFNTINDIFNSKKEG